MVTDQGESRSLEGLNATERDLLSLLGPGHTAKSIARLRSLSEAAVNERFRSARRKTGIGSSREIARQIVAQENRDDFIGLGAAPASPPDFQRPDTARLRPVSPLRRWRLPMMTAGLFAIAILAQQTSVAPATTRQAAPIPPEAAALFAPQAPAPDLLALHAEVTASTPDPVWSRDAEAGLTRGYHRDPAFSAAIESLDVTCGASLCEVIGVTRPDLTPDEAKALAETIKVQNLFETATRLKLSLISQSFNSSSSDLAGVAASKSVLVAYWRRAEPR